MRTLFLSIATIASLHLFAGDNSASSVGAKNSAGNRNLVHREMVNQNFEPTMPSAGRAREGEMLLMREKRRTAEGWLVKVKAADGSLRMQGTYSDEKLTVQNGTFSYYHDNGRLESEGQYVNGVKSGVWKRFDRDGHALCEKVYGGQTYEQMAASHGWNPPATKK